MQNSKYSKKNKFDKYINKKILISHLIQLIY